eukprot:TRINITY_DN3284_c0_g1_i2.p1 TRINITY_DN3284_c0_g1~~TRINITY_DN3284_c0_g1_i2.p1  ORF type:complete len:349 (+),score=67.94 TRINITY_DN3284_c0_g1_i2:556-1602(+)
MPFDFFEQAKNVKDPSINLKRKIKFTVNIGEETKDFPPLYENFFLEKRKSTPVTILPIGTYGIKFDSSEYVFAGMRIAAEARGSPSISVCNRKLPIKSSKKYPTEICLCDAEILPIENQTLNFTLSVDNSKVIVKTIEFFVFSNAQFGFEEKLAKIEKSASEVQSLQSAEKEHFEPILSTKTCRIIPWAEKDKLITEVAVDLPQTNSLIVSFAFLARVIWTCEDLKEATTEKILPFLSQYVYYGIEDGVSLKSIRSSARKCVKALYFKKCGLPSKDGDSLYYSYKTEALFTYLEKVLKETSTSNHVVKYCRALGKIANRARMDFFVNLQKHVDNQEVGDANSQSAFKF